MYHFCASIIQKNWKYYKIRKGPPPPPPRGLFRTSAINTSVMNSSDYEIQDNSPIQMVIPKFLLKNTRSQSI